MNSRDGLCFAISKISAILLVETSLDNQELPQQSYMALRDAQAKLAIILSRYETDEAA